MECFDNKQEFTDKNKSIKKDEIEKVEEEKNEIGKRA